MLMLLTGFGFVFSFADFSPMNGNLNDMKQVVILR